MDNPTETELLWRTRAIEAENKIKTTIEYLEALPAQLEDKFEYMQKNGEALTEGQKRTLRGILA